MDTIEEHIKTIALRIQEAVRHLAPVVFEEAVPVALALVEKHGVNKVWTVDQIKVAGALELESLVKQTLNPAPTAPKDPATKTPGAEVVNDALLAAKKELDKPSDNSEKPTNDATKPAADGAKTETEGNEGNTGGGDPTGSPE